jgi:hypothetical protein
MRIFRSLMTLAFAASLAACGAKASVVDGSGFEVLTPSAGTRSYIVANDRPFADQVASHNRTCRAQAGCKK